MTQISEKPLESANPASRVSDRVPPALRAIRDAQVKNGGAQHPPLFSPDERAPVITALAALGLGVVLERASLFTGARPLLMGSALCLAVTCLAVLWYLVRLWRRYHW